MHIHSLCLSSPRVVNAKVHHGLYMLSKIERTPKWRGNDGKGERGAGNGGGRGIDFTRWTRHLSTSSRLYFLVNLSGDLSFHPSDSYVLRHLSSLFLYFPFLLFFFFLIIYC